MKEIATLNTVEEIYFEVTGGTCATKAHDHEGIMRLKCDECISDALNRAFILGYRDEEVRP